MKKKLIPLILALVCAIACAVGLAACDDGGKDVIGVCLSTAANPTEKQDSANLGNYVYGEDDKINDALKNAVKFYKQFFNNTYEEVAESELTVEYKKDGETLSEKPVKYTGSKQSDKSYYTFTYSIEGATNTCYVTFTVDKAASEDFTVTLSKNTWKYGEKTAAVTVKNPAGTAMKKVDDSGILKADDNDYLGMQLFAMKKTDYNQAGATAKSYSALTTTEDDETKPNHGFNKYFGKKLLGFNENDDFGAIKQGEYVLIACISSTHNYKEIVCAADFTVNAPDSPVGKTFVLTDLTISCAEGNTLSEGYITVAADMRADNVGKTAICAQDGKVTGTCNFGFGTFDELTGDQAFTLTFNNETLIVEITNEKGTQLRGEYKNETLTLSLFQVTDGDNPIQYALNFTFALQTAVS